MNDNFLTMSTKHCRCCGQAVKPKPGLTPLQKAERGTILAFLKSNRGNLSQTARDFGLSRVTLRKKAVQYGLWPHQP